MRKTGLPSPRRITKSSIVSWATLDSTTNDVVDDGDAIVGSPEAHDDTGPILDIAISRPAVIAALEARFVVLGLDLFLRQVAVIGMARVEQLLHRRHMQLEALGLE